MAVLGKEQFLESIKTMLKDNTSDEALKFLEDASDTIGDYEERTKDSTAWKKKYEDNYCGKELHCSRAEAFFEKLGHRGDSLFAGELAGASCQYEPSEKRADNCVSDTGENAPDTVLPARATGITDKHNRREISRAV